jgi:membrane protein implicated in regulation of membrane protease activity
MDDWVLWMIAAGVLAVGEMVSVSFFLGPVAVAAVIAAIVALAGGGAALQWIVFTAMAAASLLVLRPIARRHLHMPPRLRTGTAALVGASAVVIDRVDRSGGTVRLAGEVWSARPYEDDHAFEPGTRVEVLEIDGATALVHE